MACPLRFTIARKMRYVYTNLCYLKYPSKRKFRTLPQQKSHLHMLWSPKLQQTPYSYQFPTDTSTMKTSCKIPYYSFLFLSWKFDIQLDAAVSYIHCIFCPLIKISIMNSEMYQIMVQDSIMVLFFCEITCQENMKFIVL